MGHILDSRSPSIWMTDKCTWNRMFPPWNSIACQADLTIVSATKQNVNIHPPLSRQLHALINLHKALHSITWLPPTHLLWLFTFSRCSTAAADVVYSHSNQSLALSSSGCWPIIPGKPFIDTGGDHEADWQAGSLMMKHIAHYYDYYLTIIIILSST